MFRYTLQNGVHLDTQQLIDAVVEGADFPHAYLDLDTGVLLTVTSPEMLSQWKRSVGALSMKRYLKLEPFAPKEQDTMAREFITNVISFVLPKEIKLAEEAIVQGGWEGFEDFIASFSPELLDGWYMHQEMRAGVRIHDLLMKQDYADINSEERGCGNCAACKLDAVDMLDEEKLTELETEEVMQHVARQLDMRRHNNDSE